MTGWRPETCKCGHTIAEHRSSGSRSLSASATANRVGICLEPRCECERFTDDRAPAHSKKQASQEADAA